MTPRGASAAILSRVRCGACLFTAAAIVSAVLSSHAQVQIRFGNANATPGENPFKAVLQPSEEATTLLRRADEALERQDWKLAIDSLQRIVELPGEHVLTSDRRIYESARRHAHRRIASLPAPALQAYRLIHDGEASALMARAVEQHDEALLRSVVERYLCSGPGDLAGVTLADWMISAGRFAEAGALLRQLSEFYPDSDLPDWALPVRLAICAAGLGHPERAETILQALATRPAEPGATLPLERLAQVSRFLKQSRSATDHGTRDAPPVPYSASAGAARMPLVEPTLTSDLLSTARLSASEPKQDPAAIEAYARRRRLLPVRQLVTDGNILLVKGDGEILAFDSDSFTRIWSSRRRVEEARAPSPEELQAQALIRAGIVITPDNAQDNDAQMENDPFVRSLLHDGVGTSVSIAFNLAMTVEWPNDPPPVVARGARWIGGFPRDPFGSQPNRIVAYQAESGDFAWRSEVPGGGGGEPGEEPAEFLAAPVPVGDVLVAPYRSNSDLFAAVIDPRSGRLKRHVYLCGTGGGIFDSLQPLHPCVADGLVFIPTGRGLLVAVDSAEWSIRWAVRYDQNEGQAADAGWLATPPVAVSDVLLLAPSDLDFLVCLDRWSGAQRWRLKRDTFQYILAATDTHVWMAGRDVQMVEVATGRPVWRKTVGECTGRGVVSGDRLYLPTAGGLKAFDAATGAPVSLPQPPETPVLGNLLAWDGSLYSTALLHVTRFPDLTRGYEQAIARHRENPGHPARAIRLASLELLNHQPAKALAAMEQVPGSVGQSDPRRYGQIAHLRVRAMLELAADPERPDALQLLRDARAIAQTPVDALESALALGDYLVRKGELLEACSQFLTLALSTEGDVMVPAEAGIERRARSVAVARMAPATRSLAEADRAAFDRKVADWLQEAAGKRDQAAVGRLAESPGLGAGADQALLILAQWAFEEMRFEQAETHLLRVLRGSGDAGFRARAAARLAQIYLEPEELHAPAQALELIRQLKTDFAAVELPASLLAAPSAQTPSDSGRKLSGAEIAAALSERIDPKVLARHQAALSPPLIEGVGRASTQTFAGTRPLTLRGTRIEPLAETILQLTEGNRVDARKAADGSLLWPAELRLLGDPAVEPKALELTWQQAQSRVDSGSRARAVAEGQILVVNTDFGIHAIGLLTGRRLWSRPFVPAVLPGQDPSGSDAWLWSHNGYIVSVDARRRLEVASAAQGDRILWRCTSPARKWQAVRARGSYVVAVDGELEQVDIFDLAGGRHLGQARFTQDAIPQRKVNITLYDDLICGPASPREVAAFELAAPGVERWRAALSSPLGQIFKPTPALLAIAERNGTIQIIDPATGRKLHEVKVNCCPAGIVDGALMDGVLYVYGYESRPSEPQGSERQEWALTAVQVETGTVLWTVSGLPARTFLSDEVLRAAGNVIPLAILHPAGSPGAIRADGGSAQRHHVELRLIDRRTGRAIGAQNLTSLGSDNSARQITDVQVWPEQVLVVAGATQLRYPVTGSTQIPTTRSADASATVTGDPGVQKAGEP